LKGVIDLADQIIDMGAAIVGIKLGERGLFIKLGSAQRLAMSFSNYPNVMKWSGKAIWHPAFDVAVAGTTGAGDAAYAGFLTALLHNRDMFQVTQFACAVGASSVESVDSVSAIPTESAIDARIQNGWTMQGNPVVLDA
jgi:sugar/nucleoside kinase (ribokinase family)